MLIQKKEYEIPYDVTMFWEFFRWERFKIGHIYLQRFPNGKLYAGQSIRIVGRMRSYRNGSGANPHHSRAIEKHGWSNVNVMTVKCPWYLLDKIEIFLIAYHDLMNPKKGYNKQSGGRKSWTVSKEMRAARSVANKAAWAREPQRRIDQSIRFSGENSYLFGKFGPSHPAFGTTRTPEQRSDMSFAQMGEKNTVFGKTWTKTPEDVAKTSGENHGMYGKTHTVESRSKMSGENNHMTGKFGELHHLFGTKRTPEQIANISGENHGMYGKIGALSPISKPICVFGKVYPCSQDASDDLRADHAPNNKGNFIKDKWPYAKKRQSCMFKVSKDFYAYAMENELENITRELYEIWSAFHFV
jgi:group I intron endonuclease